MAAAGLGEASLADIQITTIFITSDPKAEDRKRKKRNRHYSLSLILAYLS